MMKMFPTYLIKKVEDILAIVIAAITSFFFSINSPLHPWVGSNALTDSSVFKTIALMMERGFIPYRDSFDHKGPLLYIINWFGNKIGQYRGVWVIEIIFLTISLYVIYKMARLLCEKKASIVVSLTAISLLFKYYEGGNLTEEYAMMFIAVGLYIFIDYFKNNKVTRARLAISGFSFGAVLLLRPNMIITWIVMCTAIFFKLIIAKEWKNLREFTVWFLTGMAIIIVPILTWLLANDALYQCWQDYIVFNMKYTDKGRVPFPLKWETFFTFFNTTVYIVSFIILAFMCTIKDKFFNRIYLVFMLGSLVFVSLAGTSFWHYGMVLVPVVVYPLSLLFAEIEKIQSKDISRTVSIIVSVYLLVTIIALNWIELIKTIPSTYETRNEEHISDIARTTADFVVSNTSEDDAISVYGNWNFIYILSNRRHATRYSYQYPVSYVVPEIMDEYFKQLQEELPRILVVQAGYLDENFLKFVNKNEYQILWSQNGDEMDGAIIFIR